MTIFALSSENMKRMNVNLIFELISNNFDKFLKDITRNNQVKIQVFGNRRRNAYYFATWLNG